VSAASGNGEKKIMLRGAALGLGKSPLCVGIKTIDEYIFSLDFLLPSFGILWNGSLCLSACSGFIYLFSIHSESKGLWLFILHAEQRSCFV
jgi:hypothetical protein